MTTAYQAGAAFRAGAIGNPPDPNILPDNVALTEAIEDLAAAVTGAALGRVDKATWAGLAGVTGTSNGQRARVWGPDAGTHADPISSQTVSNVGDYAWSTAVSGWQWVSDVMIPLVHATNIGAGTANAIVATCNGGTPLAPFAAKFIMNLTASNTDNVTVSLNNTLGVLPLKTIGGSQVAAGGLPAGGYVEFYYDGSAYRMTTAPSEAAAFNHQGNYDNGTTYTQNQIVTGSDGKWYMLTAATALGDDPVSGGSGDWLEILSAAGIADGAVSRVKLHSNLRSIMAWKYDTLATLEADTVPAGIDSVYVQERVAGKRGGAFWERQSGEPDVPACAKTQDAGSAWWMLAPSEGSWATMAMFGAFGGFAIETETRAIFNAMGTKPTKEHLRAINDFVRDMKKRGLWAKLTWIACTVAHNATDALINWKNPGTQDLTTLNDPAFIAGKGFTNGLEAENRRLVGPNFQVIPDYAQDDAHIGVYNWDDGVDNSPIAGTTTTAPSAYITPRRSSADSLRVRLNDATVNDVSNDTASGHFVLSRDNASTYETYRNGAELGTITQTSTGVPNDTLKALSCNAGSTGTGTVAFLHAGSALTRNETGHVYRALVNLVRTIGHVMTLGAAVTATNLDTDWVPGDETDTRAIVQGALDYSAARGYELRSAFDSLLLVDDTITLPSRLRWKGGGRTSMLRMVDGVGWSKPLLKGGDRLDRREDIQIENLAFDFNYERWDDDDMEDEGPLVRSCVCLSNVRDCHLTRIWSFDGYKHCFDVTAPTYGASTGGDAPASPDPLWYDPEPSEYVYLTDCYAEGGGDDNFTTHMSRWIWFTRCVSRLPSGVYVPTNTNCYEMDDGTEHAFVLDCYAYGGVRGLEIKGHAAAPAAHHITVNNFYAINNAIGVGIRHSGHHGGADPVSKTARGINASNIFVIAPRFTDDNYKYPAVEGDQALYPVIIAGYDDVNFSNLQVMESSGDIRAREALPAGIATGSGPTQVISIYLGAQNVTTVNTSIDGFADWEYGLCHFPSKGDGVASHTGFRCTNGPENAFYASSTTPGVVLLSGHYIKGGHGSTSGSYGVWAGPASSVIGIGHIEGYETLLDGNGKAVDTTAL